MMKINPANLLFNEPIKFDENVYINIPLMEDVSRNTNFNLYSRLFTTSIRLLFTTLRNVDEIEKKYPTIWDMVKDEEGDILLGRVMGSEFRGSVLIMEALNYWTGLEVDGENGFVLLSNGKMMHVGSEWIIDSKVFKEFSDMIKLITCFDPESERDMLPPKPMDSDAKYNTWISIYKGRAKKLGRGGNDLIENSGLVNKMMILTISMESYIPIDEIKKMSIFMFNKIFDGLQSKEGYERYWQIQVSPKFASDKKITKHWKETFRI